MNELFGSYGTPFLDAVSVNKSYVMHINILFPQRRRDAEKLITLCVPCDTARDNAFQIYLFGNFS